jgi:hypothetical protein
VWKSPALSLTTFEDKKPIIARCNPATDTEEITQRDIITGARQAAIIAGMTRIDRPFS